MTATAQTRLKDGRVALIRPLSMADKESLVAFYAGLSPAVLRWALPPYDRARVERFFNNPGQLIGVVGESEGKIVGHLHVFRFASRMSHVGELIVYIDQNFLNVGLGTAMMKAGISLARERGLRRVQLTVIKGNDNAVRVYEKTGFRKEGVLTEAYRGEDGRYYDGIEMGMVVG